LITARDIALDLAVFALKSVGIAMRQPGTLLLRSDCEMCHPSVSKMANGALGAFLRGMGASGFDATIDGDDIVAVPRSDWCDENLESSGCLIDDLDVPGVKIFITIADQERIAYAKDTPTRGAPAHTCTAVSYVYF
jgi:hypothetical protein